MKQHDINKILEDMIENIEMVEDLPEHEIVELISFEYNKGVLVGKFKTSFDDELYYRLTKEVGSKETKIESFKKLSGGTLVAHEPPNYIEK